MSVDELLDKVKTSGFKFVKNERGEIRCNGLCPIEALTGETVKEGARRLHLCSETKVYFMAAADGANYPRRNVELVEIRNKLLVTCGLEEENVI